MPNLVAPAGGSELSSGLLHPPARIAFATRNNPVRVDAEETIGARSKNSMTDTWFLWMEEVRPRLLCE